EPWTGPPTTRAERATRRGRKDSLHRVPGTRHATISGGTPAPGAAACPLGTLARARGTSARLALECTARRSDAASRHRGTPGRPGTWDDAHEPPRKLAAVPHADRAARARRARGGLRVR